MWASTDDRVRGEIPVSHGVAALLEVEALLTDRGRGQHERQSRRLACLSRDRGQLGWQLHVQRRAGASAVDGRATAGDRRLGAEGAGVGGRGTPSAISLTPRSW